MAIDLRTLTMKYDGMPPQWNCPAIMWVDGVTGGPAVYLRKPRGVTQEDFDRIIKAMRISMVVEDNDNG